MQKDKASHQSPLFKGGGVAEQCENIQDCVKCDDGGLKKAHYSDFSRNPKLKLPARDLRKKATKQENHLWYDFLSKSSPRFLRQYVINNYILDFYCHQAALAIEVDGSQHNELEAVEYDKTRTEYLNGFGIKVLRFSNRDVDINFNEVCKKIEDIVKGRVNNPPSRDLSAKL